MFPSDLGGLMRWIRLYHEVRTDPKMRLLSDTQFRIWLNLLLYASEDGRRGVVEQTKLLPIELNTDSETLVETLRILKELEIVKLGETAIVFINFDKRQYTYPSDRPERVAERVKRHRNGSETGETSPDTDTDTDTEADTEQKELSGAERETLQALRRYSGWNGDADAVEQLSFIAEHFASVDVAAAAWDWADYWNDPPKGKKPPTRCWQSFRNWLKNAKPVVVARDIPATELYANDPAARS